MATQQPLSFGAALARRPRRSAAGASVHDDDLTADHIRTLYEQTPITLLGNLAGLVVIGSTFAPLAKPGTLGTWAAGMLLLIVLRVVSLLRFPAGDTPPLPALLAWRWTWNGLALATAGGWAAAVWLFYGLGQAYHFVALILVVYSYMLAGVQLLATQRKVYLAYIGIGMLPVVVRVAIDPSDDFHLQLAGIMTLLLVITIGVSAVYRRAFDSTIRLKVQTEHLADQLRREKADADAARRAAEVANRAKTQFFAAASHDLRQPLHALGLFAEALRQRSQDEEVAHLVHSINSSVDALEGLFSELLDITKIDTGGVEARPEHFPIGDLFRRLRLHFEPTAFEKGLSLRFRGGQHPAYADPVLVDRIARNLLANAIRYTQDGTVLISCRRRGDKLLLQVWDTGVGIAPREQERIFEEFYQVPTAGAPGPNQRKGLGLGLAIVKRLAALMKAPLTLDSEPGRGSVFTLTLPVGRRVPPSSALAGSKAPLGVSLEHRLIVVVEDEPSVREGLEVLLKSWGANVAAFDTTAACLAWAEAREPGAQRPALAIVDYRLEGGRTGLEALQALRQRFDRKLPAIVVTGSTMSGHDDEAQTHDFHILIKPVVPNKLRAMIGFKLGMR